MRSAGLTADRVVTPNQLPNTTWENTSFGLGRQLSMARSANPLQGNAGQDIISVRYVAATGQVLTVGVLLIPDPTQPVGSANSAWSCGPCTGVTVDVAAGTVSFSDTAVTPTALSGTREPATLSGSYRLPDWRPRAGTTVSASAVAACVLGNNATAANFGEIGCLNGTYVGTGIEGQACTVQIDTTAQTFRFDDGVKNNTFGFSSGGGFTNLSTFRSAFTQLATLSRPGVPLENISIQASPSAVVPDITTVELKNVQYEGGTLNYVYSRSCRIEFDLRTP